MACVLDIDVPASAGALALAERRAVRNVGRGEGAGEFRDGMVQGSVAGVSQ